MKHPYLQFYTGDFLHDPGVRSVTLAARGLWMDMLCLMHQSNRRGYLEYPNGAPITPVQLARLVGHGLDEVAALLQELDERGVYSYTPEGVIYSRRMVRDEEKRQKCMEAGKRGGNPALLAPLRGTLKDRDKPLFQKSEVRSQSSDSEGSEAKASSPAADAAFPLPASPSAAGKKPKARKQRAAKAESPPDPRFKPVTDGYCTAYREVFGTPYVHASGRDGKRLQIFLKVASIEHSAEQIVAVAQAAMERSKRPFAKATKFASSLSTFCDQFSAIQAELQSVQQPHGANGHHSNPSARRFIN